MTDVEVLDDPAVAGVVLDPLRARILAALAQPGSASTVAQSLGETRQKINYHLRSLEAAGLVHLVEERARRGLTERVVQATAGAYLVSPAALGDLAPDVAPDLAPHLAPSRLSHRGLPRERPPAPSRPGTPSGCRCATCWPWPPASFGRSDR